MNSGGQPMKYPYTLSAKVAQFPFKWIWTNARYVRYLAYSLIGTFPVYISIHKAANSEGNVLKWNEIRERRKHSHFEPVH